MAASRSQGWQKLVARAPWRGDVLAAYSEYMPPPRLGRKPLGEIDRAQFSDDGWGWNISEYEEAFQLAPGLKILGSELVSRLRHLARREPAHGIAVNKLRDNPYWPEALQRHGAPANERLVVLAACALSRTQDDKGRVRWTLFGGSELGPGRPFWRSFFRSPDLEVPAAEGLATLARLLAAVYGVRERDPGSAGLRILPLAADDPVGEPEILPSWTRPLLFNPRQLEQVRFLLTFRPFASLPQPVQAAYLAGRLALLPFPGALLGWGVASYRRLAAELPRATQLPLLQLFQRHEGPRGLRIPQSGWMHEPSAHQAAPDSSHGPLRNTFRRTHRWARVHRDEDELAVAGPEDHVAHVLFSAAADDVGLYGKPMARNAQLWTVDGRLLLDGPRARRGELERAARTLAGGGQFGYRFFYPPMQVGRYEVYWHRPLVAWASDDDGEAEVMTDGPLGVLTASRSDVAGAPAVELWPHLLDRPEHRAAIAYHARVDAPLPWAMINARKLLEAAAARPGGKLEPSFARAVATLPREEALADWLTALPGRATDPAAGAELAATLASRLGQDSPLAALEALTFGATARRSFEVAYWKLIADLATGHFRNKDNADCVLDPATQKRLRHHQRDLDALADYLLAYYRQLLRPGDRRKGALAGSFPFSWRTDFDFTWSGGWLRNHGGEAEERNVVVVIPGRDRGRAVIMADHYDTAYMEDIYGYDHGGHGPRIAAAGADDNHSATAALMLAAPIFLDLARAGRLAHDVWLVHLTGEEFPADCLGARHLASAFADGSFAVSDRRGKRHEFSATAIAGVYVLDMVAHNNDRVRDVFQICPGQGRASFELAYHAHLANRLWNANAPAWNRRHRHGCRRGQRRGRGRVAPRTALHPILHGEVRPPIDPRSTLYNTDGQIFSDLGVPVVLFMENYDINRHGYHDSHDTLENIDLDYGAAVTAIAIESVARVASGAPLPNADQP